MLTALVAVVFAVGFAPVAALAEGENDETYILWYASNYSDGNKEIIEFEGEHLPGEEVAVLNPSVLGFAGDRNGYHFSGWNTQRDGRGETYQPGSMIVINEETTLYAQWEQNIYDMTLVAESVQVSYNGEEQEVIGFSGMPEGVHIEGVKAQASGIDAGEYPVEFVGTPEVFDGAGNDVTRFFAIKMVPGTFVIEPHTVTLQVGNYVKTEGKADPVFTAEANGLWGTDELSYDLVRESGEQPGIYEIMIREEHHNNYELVTIPGTLEIRPSSMQTPIEPDKDPPDMTDPDTDMPDDFEEGTDISDNDVSRNPEMKKVPLKSNTDRNAVKPQIDDAGKTVIEEGTVAEDDAGRFTAADTSSDEPNVMIEDEPTPLTAEPAHQYFPWWVLVLMALAIFTGIMDKRHRARK